MKKKILFIMHMPPPVHGAAMVGQWIHDSKIINESFDTYYINPSVSLNVSEVGKVSILKLWLFLKLLFNIIRTILSVKPDLCYYTPTSDGYGIYRDALTISFIRFLNVKVVLHFHNKGVREYSVHRIARIAYRLVFRKVKVILIANQLYNDISDYVNKDDVYFLSNGIPRSVSDVKYGEILKKRREGEHFNRLLFLSNLITTKGVWVLLEACEKLNKNKIPFQCYYVGNSGDVSLETLKQEVKRRGLQDCVFVEGPKYNDEKEYYFINSDIFVFPTYHETFGLVLLESMEYGLPCITTPEGGIPSLVINNYNGILVQQHSSQDLYIAIKDLIFNISKRQCIGEKGHNIFIKKYTIEHFEYNLRNILLNITR